MGLILEKVPVSSIRSFSLKEEILPYIKIGWHFHPEYELTFFTESTGKRCIGDHTDNLKPGDLLLIGPNLPHFMRNDPIYYEGHPDLRIRAIVVHFHPDFLGKTFFDRIELNELRQLLHRSRQGIAFGPEVADKVGPKMENLLKLDGFPQLRLLLDILYDLTQGSGQLLASVNFRNTFREHDGNRIDRVYHYLLGHFQGDVQLSEVAGLVSMNTSAFCKFIKMRTGRTFTQVLNEIRIGHACKLLMKPGFSATEACYQSGFNNQSYFNRKFKELTDMTPRQYQRNFKS